MHESHGPLESTDAIEYSSLDERLDWSISIHSALLEVPGFLMESSTLRQCEHWVGLQSLMCYVPLVYCCACETGWAGSCEARPIVTG